jgi:hypothetical protein
MAQVLRAAILSAGSYRKRTVYERLLPYGHVQRAMADGGRRSGRGKALDRLRVLGVSVECNEAGRVELRISDYAEIGSLQQWLEFAPDIRVLRIAGPLGLGDLGALDVLTVLAGSSSLVAALKMIPDFLRSRRAGLSIQTTVKGEPFILDATNVDQVMPILERLLDG